MFNLFLLFCGTLRHIELCSSVISHMQRNPPTLTVKLGSLGGEPGKGGGGEKGEVGRGLARQIAAAVVLKFS